MALKQREIDFVANELFSEPQFEVQVVSEEEFRDELVEPRRAPAGSEAYMAHLFRVPLLTFEQEQRLFRRMNFRKYQAAELQRQLEPQRPDTTLMDRIEALLDAAEQARSRLIVSNLRLVISIVKRMGSEEERRHNFDDLVSEGNEALMRAVDRFDYSRGYRLSTYATYAIYRNLQRVRARDSRRRETEVSAGADDGHDLFNSLADDRAGQQHDSEVKQVAQSVRRLMRDLDARERHVLRERFGVGTRRKGQTLSAIGREMGISKERVRQLVARALEKLRTAAAGQGLTLDLWESMALAANGSTGLERPRPR